MMGGARWMSITESSIYHLSSTRLLAFTIDSSASSHTHSLLSAPPHTTHDAHLVMQQDHQQQHDGTSHNRVGEVITLSVGAAANDVSAFYFNQQVTQDTQQQ